VWTWSLLVNRTDVWGRYGEHGTYTAPAVSRRGAVYLAEADVVRHFLAQGRDDVLGLHTTSPDNLCRWVAADIDKHGDCGNAAAANLVAAVAWHDRAKALGFRPLLTTSNGVGGGNRRIVFREPVGAPLAFSFIRWLLRDHPRHGLPTMPEAFPKQPAVRPGGHGPGCYGNWLRMPGRHHRRDYWSAVWDGRRWLGGAPAVEWLLSVRGDNPGLIPRDAAPKPPPVRPRRRDVVPGEAGDLGTRIAAYVARVPNLGEGQGRDDNGFRLACFLVRDLALDDGAARPWLEHWDAGNSPPKGDAGITMWLHGAASTGSVPTVAAWPRREVFVDGTELPGELHRHRERQAPGAQPRRRFALLPPVAEVACI
jgi:hypothetical protein